MDVMLPARLLPPWFRNTSFSLPSAVNHADSLPLVAAVPVDEAQTKYPRTSTFSQLSTKGC